MLRSSKVIIASLCCRNLEKRQETEATLACVLCFQVDASGNQTRNIIHRLKAHNPPVAGAPDSLAAHRINSTSQTSSTVLKHPPCGGGSFNERAKAASKPILPLGNVLFLMKRYLSLPRLDCKQCWEPEYTIARIEGVGLRTGCAVRMSSSNPKQRPGTHR